MTAGTQLIASGVKARADFVAIVSQYTSVRRRGRQYVGLCPFHSERHPSFYVHEEKKVFHCFGCGAGGDVFAFVMRAESCDFYRALETVAHFATGVARPSGPRSGPRSGASEGASPPAAKRPSVYSQSTQESRAQVLAALDATDRRLARIAATNAAASAALATACEPERLPLIRLTNGVFEPECVPFLPDENGNPSVPRAVIPRFGEPCQCLRCVETAQLVKACKPKRGGRVSLLEKSG